MKNLTLTIMCGLPASGKSTWAEINKKSNVDIVCPDTIRKEVFGHQFYRDAEPWIWAYAESMTKLLLAQNRNVVIDATNLTYYSRNKWLSIANHYGAVTELVLFRISKETCLKRNSKREKGKRVPQKIIKSFSSVFMEPDGIERNMYDKIIEIGE